MTVSKYFNSDKTKSVTVCQLGDYYELFFYHNSKFQIPSVMCPAHCLAEHIDQYYFGYYFLVGFAKGFTTPVIPPSENTDNKIASSVDSSSLGVVDSEGEALFSCIAEKEKSLNNCSSCSPQDFHYCARRTVFLKIGFNGITIWLTVSTVGIDTSEVKCDGGIG